MAHQPADQDHVERLDRDCHEAGCDQGPGGPGHMGQQGDGCQQEGHARRLVENEVPVGDGAVGQAHGGAEPYPVVVLEDGVRTPRPQQLEHPQGG